MKRLFSFALLLLLLLPVCTGAAAERFYTEYTPKSANSSVFYVDVFCRREITAAVFELSYPDNMVSYYSVVADNASATVRENPQKGKIVAAFADSSATSGKLCRFSFKALQTGTVRFVLHMRQAAGADHRLLSGWSDHTLSIKLGKDDIVSSPNVNRTDKASGNGSSKSSANASSRSSSPTKRGGGKSEILPGEDDGSDSPLGLFDLRDDDNKLKWILLGAGIPLLIGALLWAGILIGRRSKDKSQDAKTEPNATTDDKTEELTEDTKEEPGDDLPEPDDTPDETDPILGSNTDE